MNAILLSADPVALDATICRLIDLDPRLVPTIAHGEAFGLGSATAIHVVGEPMEALVARDFDVDRGPRPSTGRLGRVGRVARRLIVPRPAIRAEACTRCGTCVRVCPVTPKAVEFETSGSPPVHRYDRCIRCYCCQELCPEGAIEIDVPPLGRLIHR
jgi:MinD superfamily P-loop ATPase